MPDSIFHCIQTRNAAIERGQIQPRARRAMAGLDGRAIFVLCRGSVFILFGEAPSEPTSFDRVGIGELLGLAFGLIASATHDCWSLHIELRQISARFYIIRIQPYRGFEFVANFL